MVFIGKYRAVLHIQIKFEYEKPWSKLNVYFNKKKSVFKLYNI